MGAGIAWCNSGGQTSPGEVEGGGGLMQLLCGVARSGAMGAGEASS